jgi:predicted dehydrogenase
LHALASRYPRKAKAWANELGCAARDYDGLIRDDDVDAIYVSLPTGLHYAWGRRVLAAGKHLLCEKTFTQHAWQARELVEDSQRRGLVAMEALMYLFHPLLSVVEETVAAGAIGALRFVDASFGVPPRPAGDIRLDATLGGGALSDVLVYPLSLALRFLGGPPRTVNAHVVEDDALDVDVRGAALLERDTVLAHISWGFGLGYRNTYTLWGTSGFLVVDRGFTRPADFSGGVLLRTSAGHTRELAVPPADHFQRMWEVFAARVSGAPTRETTAEGAPLLARMAVLEAIRAARRLTC